ncbi:MAG: asparagine synthase C-terminal domain-containing protein [Armatimonadota bacterium]
MSHFVCFPGSDRALLDRLLPLAGKDPRTYSSAAGTVVVTGAGGEPTTVSSCAGTGELTVRRGDPSLAGCSVTFSPDLITAPRLNYDPFGQHRLFQSGSFGGTVAYASDPRLLRSLTSASMNAAALKGYLCLSHVPAPLTLWKGIDAAATMPVTWAGGGDYAGDVEFHALLALAVERRLTTGDIGVYLSGGLDSSLVAALLVQAGIRPRLFSLDFGPPYDQELPIARTVAANLGLPLTVVPARPRHVLRAVAATARALPQPFGDSVTVPLYLLGQAARDHVSEVWNGEGGDQVFGGWANKPMIAALTHGGDMSEAAERTAYAETYHRFWGLTDRLLAPDLRAASAAADPFDWIRPALDRDACPTLLHRLRAANLHLKGAQNIAPRMVALAECHGLRVRAPFFDRALAEASFRLPPEQLLAGACEKFLLKQIAEKHLPPEVVWREKRGMGVPSTEWCLRPGLLGWDVRRRLSRRRVHSRGWFQPDLIHGLLRAEDPTAEGTFRRRRVGEKLWQLYMLDVWCEVHGIA